MKKHLKIICLIFTVLPGGCISLHTDRWTTVNLGGALNKVGYEHPCKQEMQDDKGQWYYHIRAWKRGERYIIEIPVAFVPLNPPIIEHSAGHNRSRKSLDNEYWGPSEEEIATYPTEFYYADLSRAQFERLCQKRKVDYFRNPFPGLNLIPAAEMNFSGATLILDAIGKNASVKGEEMSQFRMIPNLGIIRTHSIPPRRSTLNYCLQPIRLAAEVVDIPLSLIATPIGWVVDAIYEPLNN